MPVILFHSSAFLITDFVIILNIIIIMMIISIIIILILILILNIIKVETAPWMTERALTMRDCMIRQ